MKWMFIFLIHIYWLIPKKWRRHCIFKHTCSNYVYQTTKEQGFLKGIKALKQRMKQCTPYYAVYIMHDQEEWVILQDSEVIARKFTNV
ncbi:membrane protein insertion efficiency factor YidD [Chitinophaga sp.]|uniref:membrane protein insertion efficiency factor YidD n=1 Tax=Chitinophaga sp. TaxID=1869181 RepID=UPI0031DCFF32